MPPIEGTRTSLGVARQSRFQHQSFSRDVDKPGYAQPSPQHCRPIHSPRFLDRPRRPVAPRSSAPQGIDDCADDVTGQHRRMTDDTSESTKPLGTVAAMKFGSMTAVPRSSSTSTICRTGSGAAAFAPGDCGHESHVFDRVSFLGPCKLQTDELHSGSTAVLRATVNGQVCKSRRSDT
jgi:hypothetical protein